MPASFRSLVASSSVRALALLVLAAASAACSSAEPEQSGSDGSNSEGVPGENGEDGEGNGPNPPQSLPDSFGCTELASIIQTCNLATTREANLAAGFTPVMADEDIKTSGRKIFDLYQPTEECKDLIAEYFEFDSAWSKPENKRARDAALNGLHTLFFHPMFIPADGTMIWSGQKFDKAAMLGYGATEIPASKDYVLRRDHANIGLMQEFRANVTQVIFQDYIDAGGFGEVKMQTWGGHIEVNASWITLPPNKLVDDLDFVRFKYDIASTFFHEFRHADGFAQHDGCTTPYLGQTECDNHLSGSSYGRQAQVFHALLLGAAYTRPANDYGLLSSKEHMFRNHRINCERATEKVNDLGDWVKQNDPQRSACAQATIANMLAERKISPSGAPPVDEDAGFDWECK